MSSTRYKISNRNIYGFKINLPQTILLLPVMMALALLVEFALGPILYPFYQKEAALEENAVGNEAGQDIPVASSIADMETLGAFTLIVKGVVINNDTVRSGNEIYHRVQLPSGEKVIAHINKKAIQDTDEPGVYRMPAGTWKEWDPLRKS